MGEPAPRKRPKHPVVERRGLTVQVDGEPTLHLASPVVTRPQDWNLRAATLLFGEAAALRAHQDCCIQERRVRG